MNTIKPIKFTLKKLRLQTVKDLTKYWENTNWKDLTVEGYCLHLLKHPLIDSNVRLHLLKIFKFQKNDKPHFKFLMTSAHYMIIKVLKGTKNKWMRQLFK